MEGCSYPLGKSERIIPVLQHLLLGRYVCVQVEKN